MVDGEPVQWQRAEQQASGDERSVIAALKLIAGLRRWQGQPTIRPARRSTVDLALGIPLLLAILQVASACVSLALVGNPFAERLLPAQLAICLSFVTASAILLFDRERDRRATLLAHIYLLVSTALARPLFRAAGAQSDLSWLWPIWHGLYPESFLAVAIWRFTRVFPYLLRFGAYDRVTSGIVMGAGISSSILFILNIVFAYVPGLDTTGGLLSTLRRTDPSGHFWHVTYLFVVSALITIPVRAWRAALEERRRTLWFGAALLTGTIPIVTVSALELLSPAFRALKAAGGLPRTIIDSVVLLGLLSIPLTTSYIILVHRVLAVRVVISELIQVALSSRTLTVFLAVFLIAIFVEGYSQRSRSLAEIAASGHIQRLAILFVSTILLLILRRRLLGAAAGLLRTDPSHDFEQSAVRIAEAVARARTPREIAFHMTRQLGICLGVSQVVLLGTHPERDFDVLDGTAPLLPKDSGLAAILTNLHDPLLVRADGPLFPVLPEADRQWLQRAGFDLIVPIRSPGDSLVGMLALGRKGTGLSFTRQDVALLKTTTATLSAVLEGHRTQTNADEEVAHECLRCHRVMAASSCDCGGSCKLARLPALVAGKFRVIQKLGQGAMGVVYLARDDRLHRFVALKTLPDASGTASQAMFLEAQAMAASEHPNLACVYGLEMWRATPILIVEHLPGGTLSERLRTGALALDEALSIGAQLADALEALHSDGTLHRDIKPSNIGFGRAGAPKLLDFGLARLLGPMKRNDRVDISPGLDDTSEATAIAGTPLYLSPESLAGEAPDEFVDLWALSLVVFEAIAGAHPFAATSVHGVYRRIRTEQPNLRRWQPDIPDAVQDFMARALALDRDRRPATARQLASELRRLAQLR